MMDEGTSGDLSASNQDKTDDSPLCDPQYDATETAHKMTDDKADCSRNACATPNQRYRVTVEPVLFLFLAAAAVSGSVLQTLYLERTCEQDLHRDAIHCLHLNTTDNNHEQPHTANLLLAKSLLEALLPAVLSLFLGPWSDRYGRKPLMMVSLAGHAGTFAAYAWLSTADKLPAHYLVLGSLPVALSGGFIAMFLSALSYITDISPGDQRSFRLSMLDTCVSLSFLLGTACSAPLFNVIGFVGVFSAASGLCFLALLYTVLLLPESVKPPEDANSVPFCTAAKSLMVGVFRACFMKRPGNRRSIILISAGVLASLVLSINGDGAILYLFTTRKFGWDISDYTHYVMVGLAFNMVGTTTGVYLLVNYFGLSEAPVAVVSFLFRLLGAALIAFSPRAWVLYLAPAVSFPGAMAGALTRSVLSKCVPPEDVGKAFSLTAFLEAVTPLVANPLYTLVYEATIVTFPGAFALVSAGIFAYDALLMLVVTYVLHKHGTGVPYQHLSSSDSTNC